MAPVGCARFYPLDKGDQTRSKSFDLKPQLWITTYFRDKAAPDVRMRRPVHGGTPQPLVDLLLANETVSVRVPHVLVSRVVSTHRRDAVSASLGTGDASIPVVII